MHYTGITGTQYSIGQVLRKDSQSTIYAVDENPEIVLKEYIPSNRTIDKKQKLEVILNLKLPPNTFNQISWPLDIVSDNGKFVGYVMSVVRNGQYYNEIFSNKFSFTLEEKLSIAMNLCTAVDSVHGINQICGDLSPKNIQVDIKSSNVKLINTDSFHIRDYANNQIYRCDVGMAEYLAPELQIKAKDGLDTINLPTFTKESDLFALAVHIFTILMNGCHPFTSEIIQTSVQESVVSPSMIENIANGNLFFYQNTSQDLTTTIYAPTFEVFPEELQEMFVRAFVHGHTNPIQRPTASEWYEVLYDIYTSSPTSLYPQWANAVTAKSSTNAKKDTQNIEQNISTHIHNNNDSQSKGSNRVIDKKSISYAVKKMIIFDIIMLLCIKIGLIGFQPLLYVGLLVLFVFYYWFFTVVYRTAKKLSANRPPKYQSRAMVIHWIFVFIGLSFIVMIPTVGIIGI